MAQRTPEQQHKRQYRIQIILPIILGLLIIIAMMVLLVVALDSGQVSLATDFMAIIFCLFPAVIMCLIPSLGLVAAALWIAFSADKAQPPLARGRLAALNNLGKVQQYVPRIAQPIIVVLAKLTQFENILGIHQPTDATEEKQDNER